MDDVFAAVVRDVGEVSYVGGVADRLCDPATCVCSCKTARNGSVTRSLGVDKEFLYAGPTVLRGS